MTTAATSKKHNRVTIELTTEELKELRELASREDRTVSKQAKRIFMAGWKTRPGATTATAPKPPTDE